MIRGGYIEDIVLKILVDSRTNVCAKWCFYTHAGDKKYYKAPFSFNFQPCPMSPPQDAMPYPRLQGSHYPRQWWPGNRLPLPCNYPPRRQWPGSHYPRQWWPGNRIPLPGSHHPLAARLYLPLLQWPGSHYPRLQWPVNQLPLPGSCHPWLRPNTSLPLLIVVVGGLRCWTWK